MTTTEHENRVDGALKPVSDWENREVNGEALSGQKVYDRHVQAVEALRKRQAAYIDSLPQDPIAALAAIDTTLKDLREWYSPEFAPKAALVILCELISPDRPLYDAYEMRASLNWLIHRALSGLDRIESDVMHVKAISGQFREQTEAPPRTTV